MTTPGWTIYYNPKCGTCRKVLDALRAKKIEPRLVEYLKTPPTAAELETILKKTGGDPHALVRAKEDEYAQEGLSETSSAAQILKAIAKHPVLLQRPVVLSPNGGLVARPPEKVEELF